MDKTASRVRSYLRIVGEEWKVLPEHEAFESMLDGWRAQRLSRSLSVATVDAGARVVVRFQEQVGTYPWEWSAPDLEGFIAHLRSHEGLPHSIVRNYLLLIGWFCDYLCDPTYGWNERCLDQFGSRPVPTGTLQNIPPHSIDNQRGSSHQATAYQGCRESCSSPLAPRPESRPSD